MADGRPQETATPLAANFDHIAPVYDATFMANLSTRLQREQTWRSMEEYFPAACRILEMSCGTGEDAFHLASLGYRVESFDASPGMIQQATQRALEFRGSGSARFRQLAFEQMHVLRGQTFDAGLTNFGGLNCVEDLSAAFRSFAMVLAPGAPLVVNLIGRFCLWEMAWPLLRGRWRDTLHRAKGYEEVSGGRVRYPSVHEVRRSFAPWFRERSVQALGLTLPSYRIAAKFENHSRLLRSLAALDSVIACWPGLRALGDNTVFVLERNASSVAD